VLKATVTDYQKGKATYGPSECSMRPAKAPTRILSGASRLCRLFNEVCERLGIRAGFGEAEILRPSSRLASPETIVCRVRFAGETPKRSRAESLPAPPLGVQWHTIVLD
jgi:hypothetical protein